MFLVSNGVVAHDFGLALLAEVLCVIDRRVETIINDRPDASEADALGDLDRIEHAVGLGFVTCQVYLTTTYGSLGFDKAKALAVGPRVRSGQSLASLVNHAANYWKHQGEWGLERGTARQERTREAFDDLGCPVDLDYPLQGILRRLAAPEIASLTPLVPLLMRWRDDLRAVQGREVPGAGRPGQGVQD